MKINRSIHFPADIKKGMRVGICHNPKDQNTHERIDSYGTVTEIISKNKEYCPEGVKVRIDNGMSGYLISIDSEFKFNNLKLMSESTILEFKETFQFDIKKNEKLKCRGHSVVETIAAYANTSGGTLLIGVNDDKELVGLQPDFNNLNKTRPTQTNDDKFKQEIAQYIESNLLVGSIPPYEINMRCINDKYVCIITVVRSDTPVYVKYKMEHKDCVTNNIKIHDVYLYYKRMQDSSKPVQPTGQYLSNKF